MPILKPRKNHKRVLGITIAAMFGMFLFAFAMVPLYDVFCEMTGINNKGEGRVRAVYPTEIDTSRTVKITFMTHVNGDMPWEFYPEQKAIEVHPGEVKTIMFYAENTSADDMIGSFIATISPGFVTRHVKKTECFSFAKQMLYGETEKQMPVVFFVDHDIPKEVEELTMFYSLFDNT